MEYKDYYKTLGVDKTATKDDIKKSYRRLARKYHPDVSKEANAEAKFKELSEAYDVIGDEKKRAQYDQLGSNWNSQNQHQNHQSYRGQSGFGQGGGASGFSDFFDSFFAGGAQQGHSGRQQHQAPPPEPQTATLHLDLDDVFEGVKKTVRLPNGKSVDVKIPKGIEEGKKIRLKGKALTGGDLFLKVKLNKHVDFNVENKDIFVNLFLSPWEAALGDTVAVKTLAGSIKLKIPAGAYSGQKMRLRGKGLPGEVNGDQYVVINVATPPAKTDADRDFYKKMKTHFKWDARNR